MPRPTMPLVDIKIRQFITTQPQDSRYKEEASGGTKKYAVAKTVKGMIKWGRGEEPLASSNEEKRNQQPEGDEPLSEGHLTFYRQDLVDAGLTLKAGDIVTEIEGDEVVLMLMARIIAGHSIVHSGDAENAPGILEIWIFRQNTELVNSLKAM